MSLPALPWDHEMTRALLDLGMGTWHGGWFYGATPTFIASQRRGKLTVELVVAMTPSPPECRVKAIITSHGQYEKRLETIHRLPVIPWTDDLAGDVARHLAEHKLAALVAALEVER